MINKEKLVEVHEEYIKFLEREVVNLSSVASIYGWYCPKEVYEEGITFRETIKEIKNYNGTLES